MTRSSKRQNSPQPAAEVARPTMEPSTSKKSDQAPSPTRSDKSSESEGRPVREKLKETRIDAQASSDRPPSSDQPMNDAPTNGTRGDNSTSGSDSERGRLRRKRSREDFEDENDEAKHPEKKHERHARKKSRDITSPSLSDADVPTKQASTLVPPIRENDDDENVRPSKDDPQRKTTATNRQSTPETSISDIEAGVTSPKNKRTREQAEAGHEANIHPTIESNGAKATVKPAEERDTKRPRDATDPNSLLGATESKTKIPPGSGFANTSSTSPFAAMSPQPPTTKSADTTAKDPSQASDSAFKSSGFGAFAKSSASPFGAANASTSGSFAGAGGNKLSSFASKPATTGGFGALTNSAPQSSFGGSASGSKIGFGTTPSGGGFGSGFGSVAGTKLSSFASSSGSAITGLKEKTTAFGAPETAKETTEDEEEEYGDDDQDNDGADDPSEERRASQTLLQASGPLETGEENEDAIWTGRAKLYTLAGEAGKKEWQERGVGPFKLNVSRDPPLKARFVLRADGTHRLILNAAVTGGMRFGDGEGEEPKDGKLLFTAPKADGEVESHLLKLRAERGIELWRVVKDLKKTL